MNGNYEQDMAKNYDFREGVMGQIKSVKNLFTEDDIKNGTLIKNLDIDGDVVAMACQEFIPQLNSQKVILSLSKPYLLGILRIPFQSLEVAMPKCSLPWHLSLHNLYPSTPLVCLFLKQTTLRC